MGKEGEGGEEGGRRRKGKGRIGWRKWDGENRRVEGGV